MSMLWDNIMNAEITTCSLCDGEFQRGVMVLGKCPGCRVRTENPEFFYQPSKMFMDVYSFSKRIQPDLTVMKSYSNIIQDVTLTVKIGDKVLKEGNEKECLAYLYTCDIHKIHRI